MRVRHAFCAILMVAALTSDADAQWADPALHMQDTTHDIRSNWRPMRIAKWTSLVASAGAAAYGFTQNRVADRDYEKLERDCEAAPLSCAKVAGSESYADAALEQRYQKIVKRDNTARTALLAGQIGLAASVVMFIIDLPERETPEDIPYEPKPVRFGLSRDGGAELAVRLRAF